MSDDEIRVRIVAAAIALLTRGGREALTTRAVADKADVQAPTIYRLFGDKNGLLEAVAEHGYATYMKKKVVGKPSEDPVEGLRAGWDQHIEFGLANPAIYSIMIEPKPGVMTPAGERAINILYERVRRIAVAGQLRVSEQRAVELIHAAGSGTVLALLQMKEPDLALSVTAREAVIAAIATGTPARVNKPAAAAIALRARLPATTVLSKGERAFLEELLDRLART